MTNLIDAKQIIPVSVNSGSSIDSSTTLLLHFDQNPGVAFDSSNYGNSITNVGGVSASATQSTFGGYSGFFPSNSSYLTVPNATSTQNFVFGTSDFTIEFWIYLTAYPTPGSVSGFDNLNLGGAGVRNTSFVFGVVNSGKLNVFTSGAFRTASATTVSLNTWTHIALTRTSNLFNYWINGTKDANSFSFVVGCTTGGATIGGLADNQYGATSGYIDEFRVTKGLARYSGSSFTVASSAFTGFYNNFPANPTTGQMISDGTWLYIWHGISVGWKRLNLY
jgi:Concanavalin A-like lectin/glucanases superfamily